MALVDDLNNVNAVLTFLERVLNLADRSIITASMLDVMVEKVIEYLETIFPPPEA